jgi:hypothetical protein
MARLIPTPTFRGGLSPRRAVGPDLGARPFPRGPRPALDGKGRPPRRPPAAAPGPRARDRRAADPPTPWRPAARRRKGPGGGPGGAARARAWGRNRRGGDKARRRPGLGGPRRATPPKTAPCPAPGPGRAAQGRALAGRAKTRPGWRLMAAPPRQKAGRRKRPGGQGGKASLRARPQGAARHGPRENRPNEAAQGTARAKRRGMGHNRGPCRPRLPSGRAIVRRAYSSNARRAVSARLKAVPPPFRPCGPWDPDLGMPKTILGLPDACPQGDGQPL